MVANLRAFRPKKGEGNAKPSTLKATNSAGEDLSYLPPVITVLWSSLCNVPLETNAKVPIKLARSLRCQASRWLRLMDEAEEKAEGDKKVALKP